MEIPLEFTLTCSPVELVTLASLLGGESLIGLADPFPGWLTEEIEEAIERAKQTLSERGYLNLHSEGVIMDALAAALVGTLIAPQVVALVSVTRPGEASSQTIFYRREPFTVRLAGQGETLTLAPLQGWERVAAEVQSLWGLEAQPPAPAPSFVLSEAALNEARRLLPDRAAAVRTLEAAGLSPEQAQALVLALTGAQCNGALVTMRRLPESWDVGGLGVLWGSEGVWLLRSILRQGEAQIHFSPCSAQELKDEIVKLLKRFDSAGEAQK